MPELTMLVKSGMVVLVLLLIVTIFGYHVWLDRLIARTRARDGAADREAGKSAVAGEAGPRS